MMKFISKHLITGLVTILPVVLTLYFLYWMAVSSEALLGEMIRLVLPEDAYWPGMGVVAGMLVVFFVGLLMHIYVVRRLFAKGEQIFYRMCDAGVGIECKSAMNAVSLRRDKSLK